MQEVSSIIQFLQRLLYSKTSKTYCSQYNLQVIQLSNVLHHSLNKLDPYDQGQKVGGGSIARCTLLVTKKDSLLIVARSLLAWLRV
jgi:hypothetical protein